MLLKNKEFRNSTKVSMSIKSIDNYGLVNIKFNQEMIVPQNMSFINTSNTIIYVESSVNRFNDNGFDVNDLALEWSVVKFNKTNILISVNFAKPF
jgi:hypothetical protein